MMFLTMSSNDIGKEGACLNLYCKSIRTYDSHVFLLMSRRPQLKSSCAIVANYPQLT